MLPAQLQISFGPTHFVLQKHVRLKNGSHGCCSAEAIKHDWENPVERELASQEDEGDAHVGGTVDNGGLRLAGQRLPPCQCGRMDDV